MKKENSKENSQPGLSGKNQEGTSWFDSNEYDKQKIYNQQTTFSNLKGRYGFENQGHQESQNVSEELIFGVLKRSPEIDVSHEDKVVSLEGTVDDLEEARAITKIVQNIPGVSKVLNHLEQS